MQDHGWLSVMHISKQSPSSQRLLSQDHGRLPEKHIAKHSHKNLHTCWTHWPALQKKGGLIVHSRLFEISFTLTLRAEIKTFGYLFMRVLVTPAVYPGVFQILTTLTFGALRKSQCVADVRGHHKKTKTKKQSSSTCGQQCIGRCVKKSQDPTSMTVPRGKNDICNRQQNCPPKGLISITFLINSKKRPASNYEYCVFFLINSKTKDLYL